MSAKFVDFMIVTEDGMSLSTCLINVTEILYLMSAPVPALTLVNCPATLITFRGGDRKRVMGDPKQVAVRIEEALCKNQKQNKR